MPKQITSGPSDCISSIAFEQGFFPDTLWNWPENARLKKDTDFSTVLAEGEVVYVPDLRDRSVGVATDARHRFKRRGVPEKVRIRFLDELGKPRSGLPYQFRTSLGIKTGMTNGDGVLTEFIRPDETEAQLSLQSKVGPEEYVFDLGYLRPRTVDTGVRRRLTQLGYWPDLEDSVGEAEQLRLAVSAFQVAENLPLTAKLDAATLDRLKTSYGC